jgi:hypothetical protein
MPGRWKRRRVQTGRNTASNDGSTKVCFTVRVSTWEKPPARNNSSSRDASPSEKVRVTASVKPGTYRVNMTLIW